MTEQPQNLSVTFSSVPREFAHTKAKVGMKGRTETES